MACVQSLRLVLGAKGTDEIKKHLFMLRADKFNHLYISLLAMCPHNYASLLLRMIRVSMVLLLHLFLFLFL